MKNTAKLPYNTNSEIKAAAKFIAALVEHSTVTFEAVVVEDFMIVTFTGGF